MFQDSYAEPIRTPLHHHDYTDVVDAEFTFAFQPMVRMDSMEILGHEALVRGLSGESAGSVLSAIRPENRFGFDQACRVRAIETAQRKRVPGTLYLNCSFVESDSLESVVAATRQSAEDCGIDPRRIALEFNSFEQLGNARQLDAARRAVKAAGMRAVIDNLGSGEVGLKRLVAFRPDEIKLDRSLIAGIDRSPRRQAIVLGLVQTCRALDIDVIATGIERREERDWLAGAGVASGQGYLFGRPEFEPKAAIPAVAAA